MKEMVYFRKMARVMVVSNLEGPKGEKSAMEKNMLVWLVTTYGSTIQTPTTIKIMIKMVHVRNIIRIKEHFICIESIWLMLLRRQDAKIL